MKTKKLVALLLSLAVMIASFTLLGVSVSAVDVQTQINIPDGKETYELDGVTYTVINSVEEMNEVAAAGSTHYILNADLDYTGKEYKQINLTNGSLNGNGHSITGVNLSFGKDAVLGDGAAMFKNVNANSTTVTVSNLTVGAPDAPVSVAVTDDAPSDKQGGHCRVGTLFCYLNGCTATIENVTVYSNVTAKAYYRAGGIIGEARTRLIMKNCVFDGKVIKEEAEPQFKCQIGGLVGSTWNLNATLDNCASYGTISSNGGYAGGLIGAINNTITITNCANYATVSSANSAGLIADARNAGDAKLTMNNCFNAGDITGTTFAAGLLGEASDNGNANYNDTKLTNCANIATLTSDATTNDFIAVIVAASKVTVTDCGAFVTSGAFKTYDIVKAKDSDATTTSDEIDETNALKFMQDNFGFAMFGIEGGKIVVKTVPVETKFLQYKKDAEAGKMDIRVLGAIYEDDLSKYANVGFNVSVYKTGEAEALGTFSEKTNVVYESVFANDDGTITEYSADSLGVTYLYALELQNISMSGSYTFEITAFATDANNPDTIVSDITVTISIVEGVIQ